MPIRPVSIRSVPRALLLPLRQPLNGGPHTPTSAKPDPIPFLQAQPLPPNNWSSGERQRWAGVKSEVRDGVRLNGRKGERKWVKVGLRDLLRDL
ncbi:hypothetical protein QFC20_001214 [Naganishia adeliensis]|uniref:Uncharacterized protein n=1 Tax=Naganishia adeliensis TaxID=92952 RepID=A0ACC2WTS4_9TREE|nr:hypothetical protein QFC20_001214 [Naganishia adeliensis]